MVWDLTRILPIQSIDEGLALYIFRGLGFKNLYVMRSKSVKYIIQNVTGGTVICKGGKENRIRASLQAALAH